MAGMGLQRCEASYSTARGVSRVRAANFWDRTLMNAIADGDARVRLEDVHLSVHGHAIFRGLSCRFPRGKVSVILGGSGAGKSTLLRAIGGLVRPQRGVVTVAGVEVSRLPEHALFEVRQRIGM